MVSRREDVDAAGEEALGDLGGDAGAVGGVLAVGYDEVDGAAPVEIPVSEGDLVAFVSRERRSTAGTRGP